MALIHKHPELGRYFEVNKTGTIFNVHEMFIDIFDHKGNVNISKIANYFTQVRHLAYVHGEFCFSKARGNDLRTFFILQGNYNVTRSLYNKARKHSIWFRVRFSLELVSLGKSTLLFYSRMHDLTDDEILASSDIRMVMVDPLTRKSSPFDRSFLTKYAEFTRPGLNVLENYVPLRAPASVFTFQTVVRPSDTDSNRHMTNYVYLQISLDCAELASTKSFFSRFLGSPSERFLKEVKGYFAKECVEGDAIVVAVWEDETLDQVLHAIVKKNDVVLFYFDLQYHPVEFYSSSKL